MKYAKQKNRRNIKNMNWVNKKVPFFSTIFILVSCINTRLLLSVQWTRRKKSSTCILLFLFCLRSILSIVRIFFAQDSNSIFFKCSRAYTESCTFHFKHRNFNKSHFFALAKFCSILIFCIPFLFSWWDGKKCIE